MGRSRRRQRQAGDSNAFSPQPPETLSPVYVPIPNDRPPVLAPVLELEGLDPWAEIRGPALALDEVPEGGVMVLGFDDPAQLRLEPAEVSNGAALKAGPAPMGDAASAASDEPQVHADRDAADAAREAAPSDSSEIAEPVAVAPPPPDRTEILYGEARAAAEAGRCDEAKRLYGELLVTHPSHVRARNNLALLLDAEGSHQAALAELDRALDIDPDNGTLLVNRGALLGAMGRYAAAEHDLKKVLRGEPANAEALFNLGVVMSKKGLWGEAVPHLRRAVELEPTRAAAYYYLGEALNHVDDLGGALTSYQRAAELQPGNPRALYGLGIIYDRLARPDDAAHMYRRAREVGRR